MSDVKLSSDRAAPDGDDASDIPDHPASERPPTRSRSRVIPVLITLATFALAVPLGYVGRLYGDALDA
jgi:hypothetical protein